MMILNINVTMYSIIERRFLAADANRNNQIDYKEFVALCNKLNLSMGKKEMELIFKV